MEKAWVSWSSGKDAAWALHVARERRELEIVGLLTTVNAEFDRVAMHGVRRELLIAQAEATGLPVHVVPLPWPCSNADYEARMREAIGVARDRDVTRVIFGDLFLDDVRRYREEKLAGTGIAPHFPLWGASTAHLAREMIDAGVRAHLVTIDPRKVPRGLAGRVLDRALLAELPPDVDPCGENGEMHPLQPAIRWGVARTRARRRRTWLDLHPSHSGSSRVYRWIPSRIRSTWKFRSRPRWRPSRRA